MRQYVRRELRALSDEDREIFFSTLEIMHRVTTTEGVKKYGTKYKVTTTEGVEVATYHYDAVFI